MLMRFCAGIGRRTGELLSSLGVETLQQLREATVEQLVEVGIAK